MTCSAARRYRALHHNFLTSGFKRHIAIFQLIVFASMPIPFSIDLLRSSVSLGPPASPVAG